MSATPTPPARTPNGGQTLFIRRTEAADPMVRPKKRPQRRPLGKPHPNAAPDPRRIAPTSGHISDKKHSQPITQQHPPKNARTTAKALNVKNQDGFSGPPPNGEYYDYDLITTKKTLMDGLRHHVARFASKKTIEPSNPEDFTRPVRLQRRDPRAPPSGGNLSKAVASAVPDPETEEDLVDEKERERQEVLKAEKEAQKQADLEQIAPRIIQPTSSTKKPTNFNKKTSQVYDHNQTPEAKKRSQVRYEEALPWHLEDFDNKNTWVGNYESALSDMYVGLVGSPGKFRVVPMERWYKFTPKNHFKTLTIEEAEARMNKAMKEPRWIMEQQNALKEKEVQEGENRRGGRKLFLGKWDDQKGGRPTARVKADGDGDDIDFDQIMSDDEGPQLMEGEEEESKEAEKRIKRDQLQANIFDLKEEEEYDRVDEETQLKKELAKKLGKGVKKALISREKNYIYDSDSSASPYDSESEPEKDDEAKDKEKEDGEKKDDEKDERRKESPKGKGKDASKAPSGAASKGTNTHLGRPKPSDPMKNLKRPGSPDLSEASGTDSTSKKKQKQKHLPYSNSNDASNTRQSSPDATKERKAGASKSSANPATISLMGNAHKKRKHREKAIGAASGSDGEATGGDMSEGDPASKKHKKLQKLRLNGPSPGSTPRGSRAGSPSVPTLVLGKGGESSRATSPTVGVAATVLPSPAVADMSPVTDAEVIAAIPPEGISIGALVAGLGRDRVHNMKSSFAEMLKNHAIVAPNRILKPKSKEQRESEKLQEENGQLLSKVKAN